MPDDTPYGLLLGRFQPFHEGHKQLALEIISRVGMVLFAVRKQKISPSNPLSFDQVKERIEKGMDDYQGHFDIVLLPNITNVYYGRDVGYQIEKITLPAGVEAISATALRKGMK